MNMILTFITVCSLSLTGCSGCTDDTEKVIIRTDTTKVDTTQTIDSAETKPEIPDWVVVNPNDTTYKVLYKMKKDTVLTSVTNPLIFTNLPFIQIEDERHIQRVLKKDSVVQIVQVSTGTIIYPQLKR